MPDPGQGFNLPYHRPAGVFAWLAVPDPGTGFKGGIFTLLTGGGYRVWGAPGTMWGDNNGVSLAMLMGLHVILAFVTIFMRRVFKLASYGLAFYIFAFRGGNPVQRRSCRTYGSVRGNGRSLATEIAGISFNSIGFGWSLFLYASILA